MVMLKKTDNLYLPSQKLIMQRGWFIFGLILCAIGAWLSWLVLTTVFEAFQVKRWTQAPVFISEVELETRLKKKGSEYYLTVRYHYVFNGKNYENSKITLHNAGANLSEFYKRISSHLEVYEYEKKAFLAYINPRQPEQAILYFYIKKSHLSLLLMAAITLWTFGYWSVLIGLSVPPPSETRLMVMYPHQPWKHRHEWQTPIIKSEQKQYRSAHVAIVLLWNTFSVPLFFWIWEKIGGNPMLLLTSRHFGEVVLLIFPLIGLFFLGGLLFAIFREHRFGHIVLELQTFPLQPNHQAQGIIHVPKIVNLPPLLLRLKCVETYREQVVRNDKTHTITHSNTVWDHAQLSDPLLHDMGKKTTQFFFTIDLPIDVPPTKTAPLGSEGQTVRWQLTVTSAENSVFYAQFDVPVFRIFGSPP
jgi:hypothetical protein